jgi:5'-3' exonuclease
MGNSVLRIFLAAWSVLVPDAPAFLSGRRMGVDLSILAYKALSNVDTCAALYAGDQRFFVSQIKKWVTRVLLWGVSPVIVFDSDRDPVFAPKLPEQQRRRAEVAAASAALAAGGLSPEEKEKFIRVVTRPTPDLMHAVALELVKMGVPYVFAPSQTDAQMGALFRAGVIDCAFSPDSDFVAHGVYLLVRDIFYNDVSREWSLSLFSLANVQNSTKPVPSNSDRVDELAPLLFHTNDENVCNLRPPMLLAKIFVAAAALGGCDYGAIPGIAAKTAVSLLSKVLVAKSYFTLDYLLTASIDEGWRIISQRRTIAGKAAALATVRNSAAAFVRHGRPQHGDARFQRLALAGEEGRQQARQGAHRLRR